MRPGHPVALQALFHALAKLTDAARLLRPAAGPLATSRKNTHGTTRPVFLSRSCSVLRFFSSPVSIVANPSECPG